MYFFERRAEAEAVKYMKNRVFSGKTEYLDDLRVMIADRREAAGLDRKPENIKYNFTTKYHTGTEILNDLIGNRKVTAFDYYKAAHISALYTGMYRSANTSNAYWDYIDRVYYRLEQSCRLPRLSIILSDDIVCRNEFGHFEFRRGDEIIGRGHGRVVSCVFCNDFGVLGNRKLTKYNMINDSVCDDDLCVKKAVAIAELKGCCISRTNLIKSIFDPVTKELQEISLGVAALSHQLSNRGSTLWL